jgi:hypothetical protein
MPPGEGNTRSRLYQGVEAGLPRKVERKANRRRWGRWCRDGGGQRHEIQVGARFAVGDVGDRMEPKLRSAGGKCNEAVIGHLADRQKICGFLETERTLGTVRHVRGTVREWVAFMVLPSATATVGPSKMGVCLCRRNQSGSSDHPASTMAQPVLAEGLSKVGTTE